MMYCDRCNAEFPAGMIYCKWCGQVLEERRPITAPVQKCYSCSMPIQANWTFCNSCGSKLTPAAQTSANPLCLRCGAVVPPGATICVRCGERFAPTQGAPQSGSPAQAPVALQRCAACGEILEDARAYCKACGTPVHTPEEFADSPYLTQANPELPQSVIQQDPLQADSLDAQDPFYLLPTEPIQKTPLRQSQPEAANPQPAAPQNPGVSRTEVYQSVKPEASQPEPNSTIAFREDSKTSPVDAPETQNDLSAVLGHTIEYSAFNPPPADDVSQTRAINEYDADTVPVLTASDLQAEPDNFDLFSAKPDPSPQFSLDMGGEFSAGGEVAGREQTGKSAPQSGTQHLAFDQLPFESTVQENTGSLNQGRSTERLSPPESAYASSDEAKERQATATPIETVPPEMKGHSGGQTGAESPVIEPLMPPPVESHTAHQTQVVSTQPAPATPWPDTAQGSAQPAAPKKSGSPMALIAVAVVVLAAAGFAAWWFLLRAPATRPNANLATNTSTANTNSLANANTMDTRAPVVPEGMVLVAAGTYTIGRDDGDDIEKPKHTVTLKAFFLDRTEVTNADYKKFVDAANHAAPPQWKNGAFPEGQDNFPVVQVSWKDATDYAQWAGKRLPTEAEWEAAARGSQGRRYPWGDEWKANLANIESTSIQEVGKIPAGASLDGALDLIGNVWEWTADAFALYPGSPAKMPDDIDSATYRVIRGGAYDVQRKKVNLDSSYRGYIEENRKDLTKTGFRCAKDAN